jgi:hypothetical protein
MLVSLHACLATAVPGVGWGGEKDGCRLAPVVHVCGGHIKVADVLLPLLSLTLAPCSSTKNQIISVTVCRQAQWVTCMLVTCTAFNLYAVLQSLQQDIANHLRCPD